jgi:hypothetical protein
MKFIITAKNPDSIDYSIQEAAKDNNVSEDELWDACEKWVEYKEYIRIEIDTEAGTATVCEV